MAAEEQDLIEFQFMGKKLNLSEDANYPLKIGMACGSGSQEHDTIDIVMKKNTPVEIDPRAFYRSILDSGIHSDFLIKCGNMDLLVHKNIICTASKYFFNLLKDTAGFVEAKSNVLDLNDRSLPVMKQLINFMYTSELIQKIDISIDDLIELREASEYFEIDKLAAVVDNYLIEKIKSTKSLGVADIQRLYALSSPPITEALEGMIRVNSKRILELLGSEAGGEAKNKK